MKIIDLLDDKSIRLNAEVHSKKEYWTHWLI